jgi:hypothetical protein
MNKIFLKKVIENVQNEKCSEHKKSATFEVDNDIIVVGDYCCSTFYEILTKRIQEEYDKQIFLFY